MFSRCRNFFPTLTVLTVSADTPLISLLVSQSTIHVVWSHALTLTLSLTLTLALSLTLSLPLAHTLSLSLTHLSHCFHTVVTRMAWSLTDLWFYYCTSLTRTFWMEEINQSVWIWAASRQNQQNGMCAQRRLRSEWANPGHLPSLIRVFVVRSMGS